jgi:hypothetical protein
MLILLMFLQGEDADDGDMRVWSFPTVWWKATSKFILQCTTDLP